MRHRDRYQFLRTRRARRFETLLARGLVLFLGLLLVLVAVALLSDFWVTVISLTQP